MDVALLVTMINTQKWSFLDTGLDKFRNQNFDML